MSGNGSLILDPKLREPGEIYEVLEAFVKAQPESAKWNDFYAGGAGRTVLKLISALGGFDAFNSQMTLREASRVNATLPSSIREHAFNAGVFEGPTNTYIMRYEIQLTDGIRVTIKEGDLVGRLGIYEVYSLQNIDTTLDFTLEVAVGYLHTVERTFEAQPFAVVPFDLEREFVAPQLERFLIDGVEVKLRSDPGDLTSLGNDFVLRQITPNLVRIFTGNGVLGWYKNGAATLSYRYLNYGSDLGSVEEERPELLLPRNCFLVRQTILSRPVYGVSTDELRGLMLYYPPDGRIVHDRDYEGVIMRDFGGVLYDVYSYNVDPDQRVRLLTQPEYSSVFHLPQIKTLVDSRRGAGIHVVYDAVSIADGTEVTFDFNVKREDYLRYLDYKDEVRDYFTGRTLKFFRETTVIHSHDLAVDLTDKFGIRFYSPEDVHYTMAPGSFVSSYNIEINRLS